MSIFSAFSVFEEIKKIADVIENPDDYEFVYDSKQTIAGPQMSATLKRKDRSEAEKESEKLKSLLDNIKVY